MEDSRCLMNQTSLSSVYLNLDALSSSSDEETLDVKKCEDFAITFVCKSEGTGTRVNSDEVISEEDSPAVFGVRDIRQVVRRRDKPPGGPIRRTARLASRQESSALAVDLVTGKCRPGKVFRTVSTSHLTLDLTVSCTPETDILQPGAAAQPKTFRHSGCRSPRTCFLHSDCRLPHPRCRGARQRTHRLPSRPTGYVRGTLRMFRTRVVCLMCHRFHQDSLFGLPGRGSEGVLSPTMLEDFHDSVLGDSISHA